MDYEGLLHQVNELPTGMVPRMLNEKQTARMMSVSVAALRRWRHERRGPQFVRLERCVRYDMNSILRYLSENSSGNKKAADSRSAAEREVRSEHATTQK